MHDPAATGEGLRSGHWREMVGGRGGGGAEEVQGPKAARNLRHLGSPPDVSEKEHGTENYRS